MTVKMATYAFFPKLINMAIYVNSENTGDNTTPCFTPIMANHNFLYNESINESDSLVELTEQLNPGTENEINIIDHSRYYTNGDFWKTDGSLRILNFVDV